MTSTKFLEEINQVRDQALMDLETQEFKGSLNSLDSWRIAYLGRRGKLTILLKSLTDLSLEERREAGSQANQIKGLLLAKLSELQGRLKYQSTVQSESSFDVTLPGQIIDLGKLHPATQMVREICKAFVSMGFQVLEGPEVEWDRYNFEMLNIPQGHPARDMWDTMWIDYKDSQGRYPMLLRTHTSPMQARVMEQTNPPVRVLVPGKCYRYEATDATHEWHFFQVEGLVVDAGVSFANLKATLYEFIQMVFGSERRVRFRCDYFPFVEPGVEMAMDCFLCSGKGCRVCKQSGWIEIMGAGMVHPEVLKGVGYDPSHYTGFAFGMGIERMSMLKYGIDDVRLFYSNDLRFLEQF